jgi:hypothetical protein
MLLPQQREFPHDGQLSIFSYAATTIGCLGRLLWLRLFRRRSIHDAIMYELGFRTVSGAGQSHSKTQLAEHRKVCRG